jgi:hypothetical protein
LQKAVQHCRHDFWTAFPSQYSQAGLAPSYNLWNYSRLSSPW